MATLNDRVIARARKYGAKVYTHEQWGSKRITLYAYRRRTKRVSRLKADTLVQHITVTRDDGKSVGNFFADMREVESIGFARFGSGVSYNWCVDMATGEIGEGMPLDAKGTHTLNDKDRAGYSYNQNLVARAIAVIGVPASVLTPKGAEAIARLIAAMQDEGALTGSPDYLPHSFFAAKDCPCDSTRKQMAAIYRRAQAIRRGSTAPEPVDNFVTRARYRLRQAYNLLGRVAPSRKVVAQERAKIRGGEDSLLERLPKS